MGWSRSGSVIRDHSDHGWSNEPMNPLWTRIHQFICSTIIWVISDHWSWSRSSQRNAPLDSTWSNHVRTAPKTWSISRQRLTDNVSLAKTGRLECETTRRIRRASRMVVIQWYHLILNFSKQQKKAVWTKFGDGVSRNVLLKYVLED